MKKYQVPKSEFAILEVEDIITNSPVQPDNDKDQGEWLPNSLNI